MAKRILTWMLTLTLLIGILPARADAAGREEVCFRDEKLYTAVAEQLTVSFTGMPDSLTLSFPAGELERVAELKLNNRDITDLSGLGRFTGLTSLNISNNGVKSLEELSGLTGLNTLLAYDNAVSDVTPLTGLTGLRTLSIAKNKLKDSSRAGCVTAALSSLHALEDLDLSHNLLRYSDGLGELRGLRRLNLYDNAVRDLGGLSGLTALEFLSLGENNEASRTGFSGLEALDALTALRSLNFDKNATPEIMQHLGGMTELETLSLVENNIEDLTPLAGLTKLRELVLFGNKVQSLDPIFGLSGLEILNLENNGGSLKTLQGVLTEDNELVWPRLRYLGLAGCYNWNLRVQPESGVLFQMATERKLELSFRYDRIYQCDALWADLPHVDPDGTTWVSYDDFLARGEEGFDDFNAIRNAHNFANAKGCDEVRASGDKTYHIYDPYDYAVTARTNIDWKNATFVLHDEDIEEKFGRYWPLIVVVNTAEEDCVTLSNPDWTIDRSTKKLEQLRPVVAPMNEKGYERYLCIVQNDAVRQFIRFGGNANAGEPQQDRFLMDRDCNLLNDVIWDFEQITSFEIVPIPRERGYVRNGTFISNAPLSGSETPYSRGGGKQIYFNRNIQWRKCANMEISNIHHSVTSDGLCGSYHGLLTMSNCADLDVHDLTLFARRYMDSGRSTYDLVPGASVNLRFSRLRSNDITNGKRWGVMGSNYLKDVVFEDCVMNRIDAHQGIYNLTIRDCELGYYCMTLTGQGTLRVLNTRMTAEAMITLRPDYGSTWTGDVFLQDCTFVYKGKGAEKVLNYSFGFEPDGSPHWFGYDVHMPNLYIDNLTVDNCYNTTQTTLNVVMNWDTSTLDRIPENYWPRIMQLNSVRFIHNEGLSREPYVQLISNPAVGLDGNYAITDVRFRLDGAEGEDVTRELLAETPYQTTRPVTMTATEQASAENRLTLTRDGETIYEDRLLKDVVSETWTEPGLYRLSVRSLDSRKGAAGERVWTVMITRTEPVVFGELLDAADETALNGIPAGAFLVRAQVLLPEAPTEGTRLCLAAYSADGAMQELRIAPLETGKTQQNPLIGLENAEGSIAAVKLFLLGPDETPLAPAAILPSP